jgi:tRNA dimethylallyltransferase
VSKRTHVVAVVGPTGSGKARLARAAADACGALLLSCDSMKVYRRMDVGTAKPPACERGDWRGLDLVEAWESFDAARFRALFEEVRAEAESAGRRLLLSGGTMLYLKAATERLSHAPPRDDELRARLTAEAHASDLHARLAQVDPPTAARLHPNDQRRIVRALEVHELTGRPLSSFQGHLGEVRPDLERTVFVVTRERADMDARINARVLRMFDEGWVAECEALASDPRGVSPQAAQALGYRQILDWLAGGRSGSKSALVEGIQTATRRFARKQLTWIRNLTKTDPGSVHTIKVAEGENTLDHLDSVVQGLGRPSR